MTRASMSALLVPRAALDRLLPMHVVAATDGTILSAGPTIARLRPTRTLVGEALFDRFVVRRPPCVAEMDDLVKLEGRRLRLELADAPHTALNAHAILVDDNRLFLDMSFGMNVAGVVEDYGLDQADFAPTSLAIEMLYLIEAKAAAIGELRDLTERLAEQKAQAEQAADTDSLTGVLNRRGLERALEGLIDARTGFGLLHIDLDFFKAVNDTHGHAAGDKVLVRVARTLETLTRASDMIGRLGGDEFLVVVPGVTERDLLGAMATQIIGTLDQPFDIAGQPLRISASAGVTSSASYQMPDIARMIEDADRALYCSKVDGRTRATVFDPDLAVRSPPAGLSAAVDL